MNGTMTFEEKVRELEKNTLEAQSLQYWREHVAQADSDMIAKALWCAYRHKNQAALNWLDEAVAGVVGETTFGALEL